DWVNEEDYGRFWAAAGAEYRIAVDGNAASFTLLLAPATSPANDAFASATPLSGWSGSATGNAYLATREAGEPHDHDSNSVWYRWTAPAAGVVEFSAVDNDSRALNEFPVLYGGSSPSSLVLLDRG